MAAQTVVIACKYPRGLDIRLGSVKEVRVPVAGGTYASEMRWQPDGRRIHIKGPKRGMNSDDPESANTDGYALTFGVDKESAEKWFEDNAESALVLNGLIKMSTSRGELKAMTRDYAKQKSGIEPLDPNGDPRTPRRVKREEDRPGAPGSYTP